jgi:hypothetical protein
MIPDIGVMLGAYITFRCAEVLCKPGTAFSSKTARSVTNILAMLTIVVAAVVVYDLVTRGSNLPNIPGLR